MDFHHLPKSVFMYSPQPKKNTNPPNNTEQMSKKKKPVLHLTDQQLEKISDAYYTVQLGSKVAIGLDQSKFTSKLIDKEKLSPEVKALFENKTAMNFLLGTFIQALCTQPKKKKR